MREGTPNDSTKLLWLRVFSYYNFKESKIISAICVSSFPVLVLVEALLNLNRHSTESYFYALCKVRRNMNNSNRQIGDLLLKIGGLMHLVMKDFIGLPLLYVIDPIGLDLPSKLFNLAVAALTQTKTGNAIGNVCINSADNFMQNKSDFYAKAREKLSNKVKIEKLKQKTKREKQETKQFNSLVKEAVKSGAAELAKEIIVSELDSKARKISDSYKKKKEKEEGSDKESIH